MEKENPKFNALTPEVLDKNKEIYTKALDFAFDNKDIKNIAITGIYGAGKSTVWNTYVKETKKENIITVSLGKYEDNIQKIKIKSEDNEDKDNNSETKEKDSEAKNKDTEYDKIGEDILDNENRVERQIINQILSQIKAKDIPLSKYGFKSNKTKCKIRFQALALFLPVCSVLIWLLKSKSNFFGGVVDVVVDIILLLLFLPLFYFFYSYFHENNLRISKIKFRGTEADLGYNDKNDETVLDRDIKELVYLIKSSSSKIIVFEDLDRYDNIAIYTKLRELNFLLNKYSKTNDNENEEIKFVYMLRDGIFKSKNRTKFFDYIIPIVPVVDSKNSENKILEQLQHFKNPPDKKFVYKISLYIDDMRLLKNIVNEYLIYENVVAMKELDIDSNKLFALIVLKNVFPNEFDLLQEDKGYILSIFSNVESFKNKVSKELDKSLKKVNDELTFLRNRQENSKFEAMATMVPPNVSLKDYNNSSSWVEFLKDKYLNEDETFRINYIDTNNYNDWDEFTYKTFIEKYILTSQERKDIIEKLPIDKSKRIEELQKERILLEKKIREISICSVQDNLKQMTADEVDNVFKETSDIITQSHYFSLVRFLIIQGLIDETYGYYKGCFYSGSLQKNDTIFIKKLVESKEQDIFLDIENPLEIKDRLEESDFGRFNILNKKLLETCIESESKKAIFGIMDSVESNDNYISLIQLLNTYNFNTIKKFVDLMIKSKTDQLLTLTDKINLEKSELFINILISVWTAKDINKQILKKFSPYLEDTEKIISLIDENDFEVFMKNVSLAEVKFKNISKSEANKKRIQNIEKNKAYKLTINNLRYISKEILGEKILYGYLVSKIFNCKVLEATKNYIEEQLEDFIKILLEDPYYDEILELTNRKEENLEDKSINILLNLKISKELIYELINSNISYDNSVKLLKQISNNIFIENIDFSKVEIIEYIIDNEISDDNKKYICKYFNKFDLKIKEKFINVLNYRDELSSLSNNNLNDDVMTFILKLKDLDVDIKIDFICKKIDNNTDVSLLKKYIETVEEISELAEVWDNKHPTLENDNEIKVGNKLLEKGIVRRYGKGNPIKIYIPKVKKQKGKIGV